MDCDILDIFPLGFLFFAALLFILDVPEITSEYFRSLKLKNDLREQELNDKRSSK